MSIVPGSTPDPELAAFIADAVAATGGTQDAGGQQGVTDGQIDAFLGDAAAYLEWQDRAGDSAGGTPTALMPFGPATPSCMTSVPGRPPRSTSSSRSAARPATPPKGREDVFRADLPAALAGGSETTRECLAGKPLAPVCGEAVLPLRTDAVNPEYEAWLRELSERVLPGILNRTVDELVREDWRRVKAAFAPYAQYVSEKKGSRVEKIPVERLRRYVCGDFGAGGTP